MTLETTDRAEVLHLSAMAHIEAHAEPESREWAERYAQDRATALLLEAAAMEAQGRKKSAAAMRDRARFIATAWGE